MEQVFEDLVDEMTLGICFYTHKMAKLGALFLMDTDPESENMFKIVDEPGCDVFGQGHQTLSKQIECQCPSCGRNMSALRFAPHLEKCMTGRNSSRVASKRITAATSSQSSQRPIENDNNNGASSDESDSIYNDDDWSTKAEPAKLGAYTRTKRREQRKQKPYGRTKLDTPPPPTTPNTSQSSDLIQPIASVLSYSEMDTEARRNLLAHYCCVISEHTGRMCTRSIKCHQHTEDQKRNVRRTLSRVSTAEDFTVTSLDIEDTDLGQEPEVESLRPFDSGSSFQIDGARRRRYGTPYKYN